MDIFGIGAAVETAVEIFIRAARRTGRTTRLLETIKNGDCVITDTNNSARLITRYCIDHNIKARTVVIHPRDLNGMGRLEGFHGRILFDHTFLEQRYLAAVKQETEFLDSIVARYEVVEQEQENVYPDYDSTQDKDLPCGPR